MTARLRGSPPLRAHWTGDRDEAKKVQQIMERVQHPGIVRFHDWCEDDDFLHLVESLCRKLGMHPQLFGKHVRDLPMMQASMFGAMTQGAPFPGMQGRHDAWPLSC